MSLESLQTEDLKWVFFLIVFLFLALRFKVSGGEFYWLDQVKEDNKQRKKTNV